MNPITMYNEYYDNKITRRERWEIVMRTGLCASTLSVAIYITFLSEKMQEEQSRVPNSHPRNIATTPACVVTTSFRTPAMLRLF